MRDYDPTSPLIFIHIPKSAGTAVQQVVKSWFPQSYHDHYFKAKIGEFPKKLPDDLLNDTKNPPVIYGHFNKSRHFGVQDYYPTAKQFVTILRDPFETALSLYFYIRQQGPSHFRYEMCNAPLEDYLKTIKPHMLNFLPEELSMSNFRDILEERFVEIGITEHLPDSLDRIARKLGKTFDPASLLRVNVTERDQPTPDSARARFAEAHPLEFAVYDYAKSRFEGPPAD